MDLRNKLIGMKSSAETLNELTRSLNRRCSELIGVAAQIPEKVNSYPIIFFKGCKVMLHNVSYDAKAMAIVADVTLPYLEGNTQPTSGTTLRVAIDPDWFKEDEQE